MADDTTPQIEATEETTPTPTPTSTPTPTPTPTAHQTMSVGGQNYTFEQLQQRAEHLENYQRATSAIMNPNTDPSTKEQAARYVLSSSGYTPDQVEEYVSSYISGNTDGDDDTTEDDYMNTDETPDKDTEDDGNARAVADAILQAQNQADNSSQQLVEMRARMIGERLDGTIRLALDQHPDVSVFLKRLSEMNGSEGEQSARQVIGHELRQATMDALKRRKTLAGSFDESWIPEETNKAAQAVLQKYRSVIGDVNLLGRAPETVSGSEASFSHKKPVGSPSYKKGMDIASAEASINDWATDALARAALDLDGGGPNKA